MTDEPSTELVDAIRAFVADQTNFALERITAETSLAADLGVDGDDASELLEGYANKFKVSMSGFVFLDHFGWEGLDPISPIIIFLLRGCWPRFRHLWREAEANEREITIRHLALCAMLGHWIPSTVRERHSLRGRRDWTLGRVMLAGLACIMFAVFGCVGLLILVGAVVGCVAASIIAIEALLKSNFANALIAAGISVGCAGALVGMFAHTQRYLSAKEVWHRVSPVAE